MSEETVREIEQVARTSVARRSAGGGSGMSSADQPAAPRALSRVRARLPSGVGPLLLVVIDTEEEFDWGRPFSRSATGVRAMRRIARAQAIFDDYGIRPTYVIDYPVASQQEGYGPLKEIVFDRRAEIGAHLHPWVSPPFDEQLGIRNSFPGNLPRSLEAAKLERLTERIHESLEIRPRVYKAGRYGVGPNTPSILRDLGYRVDLSACPPFDFSAEGGPDFSGCDCHPFWLGDGTELLGVPVTGAYVGFLTRHPHRIYRWADRPRLRWARLPSVLARLGALERLRLSPEGFETRDLCRLTRWLLERSIRVFSFSFHSPSLEPGCTPYVRTEADLVRFLDGFRSYFDFFFGELGGTATTPLALKKRCQAVARR